MLLIFYLIAFILATPVKNNKKATTHKSTSKNQINPLDHVDLFYGTEGGGNMFPGVTRPFGMAKVGVDVLDKKFGNPYSGYAPGGNINGISMMHESGTGGAPEYGVVSQLPFYGDLNGGSEITLSRSRADSAKVGYYAVNTTSNIDIELAAGERYGILKYNFKDNSQDSKVLVNVSHHLTAPDRPWWTQYFVKGSIDATNQGYTGSTTIKGGWGDQEPWTIYYCSNFSTAATKVSKFDKNGVSDNQYSTSSTTQDDSFGLIFNFDKESEIIAHVGISFISTSQACNNINSKQDFNSLVDETQNIWLDEVFDKFQIQSFNDSVVDKFYTNLYGTHLIPTNKTGENPNEGWSANEVYYDDFFTIWDTFRCLNPLINIVNPTRGSEIVQSLTNIYLNEGWTPDGRSANQNGRTQGGSNSDIVMADAYVKNIQNIDWSNAYKAMVNNAEVQPPYWYDSFAPDASTKQGRGALPDWLKYGYITRNYSRSVSRTIEYAYDDFALSQVAKGLGKNDDYNKYLKRSANWQNIWNKDAEAKGYSYKGFIQPKNADGSFNSENYDPLSCGGCYWKDDEYEGKPVEYGFAVPHDIQTLKSLIGSDDTFVQRISDLYPLHGKKIADVGNEPSFLTPFLFNFVNKQYKTSELVNYILNNDFKLGVNGLPGNSDGGAMQAWVIFSLIGLYPVAGTTTYLITSPSLTSLQLQLENGSTFKIKANNLSSLNIYIQSLKINGQKWDKNWIDHESIFGSKGGSIEFEMGSSQTEWESGDVPPSFGHYTL
ncbi:uncharacterized protein KGF55_003632 [Candida pseudojiufengensis]|uniref:uncharacterized protein n=1 Tax=Candida pseudojiufengensis TaxID=497109 RepID=UPI002225B553|nr:uncharacterized protein KGF55_003632 [Candida pseudojiufengensis]KAI5962556.1 hypothetical protein KGF55_003632 [Candida pseudojiufengensis]